MSFRYVLLSIIDKQNLRHRETFENLGTKEEIGVNGRKLYREYLKSLQLDCKEFIELKNDPYYGAQEITYKDSVGNKKTKSVDPVKMIYWIIRSFDNDDVHYVDEVTK